VSAGSGWLFLVLVVLGMLALLAAPFLAVGVITSLRLMRKDGKR
jgi:hypothetical protein